MTRCTGDEAAPCIAGNRCLTHGLWDALGDQIAWFMDSVTLEEVIGGIDPQKLRPAPAAPGSDPSPLPLEFQHEGRREGADPSAADE
jgi:hypothetical protein